MVMKMTVSALVFWTLVMIAAMPAQADGIFGLGLSGLPALATAPFDSGKLPVFEPLNFYVGWQATRKRDSRRYNLDMDGLWLGLEGRTNAANRWSAYIDAWVFVAQVSQDASGFEVATNPPLPTASRMWDTRAERYYVDGALVYWCSRRLGALAGFRYDHFSVRLKNPTDVSGFSTNPSDTADITVNSYLPYVGLQCTVGGPVSSVKIRGIGFPLAPANVAINETGAAGILTRLESRGTFQRGYFFEIFGEYNRSILSDASLGAFFKWTYLHGNAHLATDFLPGLGSLTSDGSGFFLDSVTFGGRISLNFGSPL